MGELTFADIAIKENRKPSRVTAKLEKINQIVDWQEILDVVKLVDKTDIEKGGAPHRDLLVKIKMLFLQYMYNFSDPELEDQVNDRISFQKFVGVSFNETVPDYTTIWRFRERLIKEKINDKIFRMILEYIEKENLLIKKGSIVDATIIESSNKPLSKKKREELEKKGSSQIDTDAQSTKKRGKSYFGYKGHIGVDAGSKIIRKRAFSAANEHDIKYIETLLSGDEAAIFGDKAYSKKEDKRKCRKNGIYYGILDRGNKRNKLSEKQKRKNKNKSRVRAGVEHPFCYMKERLGYRKAVGKTYERNRFRFDMNCILYNIFRSSYLIKKAEVMG